MNERKTENIVRDELRRLGYYDDENIIIDEQSSDISKINKLLKNASKSGNGQGYPEFIISFRDKPELVIVVECKADTSKHESEKRNKINDYAVDGVLHYASFLVKGFNKVLSIAMSGTEKDNIYVSSFIQDKDSQPERIFGNKLLPIDDILGGIYQVEAKRTEKYEDILEFSKELNEILHNLKIKEDKRSLLISGILMALDNNNFYISYSIMNDGESLSEFLVSTIRRQLTTDELQPDKIDTLVSNYEFIKNHPTLLKFDDKEKELFLTTLIRKIDEKINGYSRTYKYHDILGQFYIEFLRYSNSDKGLGIVLTPPHITEFFCDVVDLKPEDIVYDCCTGTSGFLVSAMKHMIDKSNDDKQLIKNIKTNNLIGVEYQPEIYPLAVSNMYLHGDGKTNILSGSCFDQDVKNKVKSKKPTVAFLNPPYKSKKGDIEEFEFILNSLDCLEKYGRCVAIVPMSCVLATSGERLKLKEKLLKNHTLKAVFSMPNELFNNSKVATNTCIIVCEAKVPHPERLETFFGYFKEDGFYKRKTKGRYDYDKKWNDIKNEWLDLYINNKTKIGYSVSQKVKADDEWCCEAYMETDYSTLTQSDFEKVVRDYIAFKVVDDVS